MTKSAEKWHSIEVSVSAEAAEAIEFAFNSLDASGTAINRLGNAHADTVIVAGYFSELPESDVIDAEVRFALEAYGFGEDVVSGIAKSDVEQTDWLLEWKKHWRPTKVGGFIIAPSWETVDDTSKILIRIEPNMAFGTGTHETTQLCLRAIEANIDKRDTFLDVGTGTGILAIGVALLQRRSNGGGRIGTIVACDTDVDSIAIARENSALNGVGENIDLFVGSISDSTLPADFVCANLTLDVIVPLLDLLITRAKKTLLLSGILVTQESEIIGALSERGFSAAEVGRAGEWISVLVRTARPTAAP